MEEIILGEQSLNKIIAGIDKLANTVKVTMGPEGKTVVIFDKEGKPYLTKDGVSVTDQIFLKDPIENIGAQLVKEIAQKTAKEAGDGTTTSIVITQALLKEYSKIIGEVPMNEVRGHLDTTLLYLLENIKNKSKIIEKDDVEKIALISSNNDKQISSIIGQAFKYSKNVTFKLGNSSEDFIEYREGVEYPVTYFDKKFITNEIKKSTTLEKAKVLLVNGKLKTFDSLKFALQKCHSKGEPILIITEDISENVLNLLKENQSESILSILPIKTPGLGKYRSEYLYDLSYITNGKVVDPNKTISYEDFGNIKSVTTDSNSTLIVADDNSKIGELYNILSKRLDDKTLEEYDKEILIKRLDNIAGKCAVINVGAKSELEQKERYDRMEDAVLACKSALEEGIIDGGGLFLKSCRINGSSRYDWMEMPYRQIIDNGFKGSYENVYDPAKVLRCALENSFSVVKQLLSIEGVVINNYF